MRVRRLSWRTYVHSSYRHRIGMPSLKSHDIRDALISKMKATEDKKRHDPYYIIKDDTGRIVATTSISHGRTEPLGPKRIAKMAGRGQLNLDADDQLVDLIKCPLSREDALDIMRKNWPPGSSRLIRN